MEISSDSTPVPTRRLGRFERSESGGLGISPWKEGSNKAEEHTKVVRKPYEKALRFLDLPRGVWGAWPPRSKARKNDRDTEGSGAMIVVITSSPSKVIKYFICVFMLLEVLDKHDTLKTHTEHSCGA
jgi:hypothetical protein